jgi:hypothetical protein
MDTAGTAILSGGGRVECKNPDKEITCDGQAGSTRLIPPTIWVHSTSDHRPVISLAKRQGRTDAAAACPTIKECKQIEENFSGIVVEEPIGAFAQYRLSEHQRGKGSEIYYTFKLVRTTIRGKPFVGFEGHTQKNNSGFWGSQSTNTEVTALYWPEGEKPYQSSVYLVSYSDQAKEEKEFQCQKRQYSEKTVCRKAEFTDSYTNAPYNGLTGTTSPELLQEKIKTIGAPVFTNYFNGEKDLSLENVQSFRHEYPQGDSYNEFFYSENIPFKSVKYEVKRAASYPIEDWYHLVDYGNSAESTIMQEDASLFDQCPE